jgi:hypothetical protein
MNERRMAAGPVFADSTSDKLTYACRFDKALKLLGCELVRPQVPTVDDNTASP